MTGNTTPLMLPLDGYAIRAIYPPMLHDPRRFVSVEVLNDAEVTAMQNWCDARDARDDEDAGFGAPWYSGPSLISPPAPPIPFTTIALCLASLAFGVGIGAGLGWIF